MIRAFILSVISLALLAEQAGSISGNVCDSAGKPVAKLALRLEKPAHLSVKPPGGGIKHKIAVPLQTKPSTPPVATTTTDAEGKFTMSDIAPGSYRIVGGNNSVGWIFQNVTVEAGKETKLDLKLSPPKK